MPLTKKGKKIMSELKKEYGKEKGENIFYAIEAKKTMKGLTKKKGTK